MDETTEELNLLPPEDERCYTVPEKNVRDKFLIEYPIDMDAEKAAIRVGFPYAFARQMGNQFLNEPYVARRLKQQEAEVADPSDDSNKKRILAALWREANYKGPGSSQSARVAALAKLASVAGLDAPIKQQNQFLGPDGQPIDGVFVLPGVMTPEDWKKAAAAQQHALVNGTAPKKDE